MENKNPGRGDLEPVTVKMAGHQKPACGLCMEAKACIIIRIPHQKNRTVTGGLCRIKGRKNQTGTNT